MTDNDRKLLTEWMGERCDKWKDEEVINQKYRNRTFDNWSDLGAVLLKLSKIAYIEINIYPGENVITIMPLDEVGLDCKSNRVKHSIGETPDDIPMRFCQLACDFMKEQE